MLNANVQATQGTLGRKGRRLAKGSCIAVLNCSYTIVGFPKQIHRNGGHDNIEYHNAGEARLESREIRCVEADKIFYILEDRRAPNQYEKTG